MNEFNGGNQGYVNQRAQNFESSAAQNEVHKRMGAQKAIDELVQVIRIKQSGHSSDKLFDYDFDLNFLNKAMLHATTLQNLGSFPKGASMDSEQLKKIFFIKDYFLKLYNDKIMNAIVIIPQGFSLKEVVASRLEDLKNICDQILSRIPKHLQHVENQFKGIDHTTSWATNALHAIKLIKEKSSRDINNLEDINVLTLTAGIVLQNKSYPSTNGGNKEEKNYYPTQSEKETIKKIIKEMINYSDLAKQEADNSLRNDDSTQQKIKDKLVSLIKIGQEIMAGVKN